MGLNIFQNLSWHDITREERVFCAELEFHIRKDPQAFIRLLEAEANLPTGLPGPWDSACEACFYRDFAHTFKPNEKKRYSMKRTFDIALFSDQAIIIIEAKSAEIFTTKQTKSFAKDLEAIPEILDREIPVYLIALASKTYFENYAYINRGKALEPFSGRHLSWEAVERHYPDVPLFKRAHEVYERMLLAKTKTE